LTSETEAFFIPSKSLKLAGPSSAGPPIKSVKSVLFQPFLVCKRRPTQSVTQHSDVKLVKRDLWCKSSQNAQQPSTSNLSKGTCGVKAARTHSSLLRSYVNVSDVSGRRLAARCPALLSLLCRDMCAALLGSPCYCNARVALVNSTIKLHFFGISTSGTTSTRNDQQITMWMQLAVDVHMCAHCSRVRAPKQRAYRY
jgi:hypothetical protein